MRMLPPMFKSLRRLSFAVVGLCLPTFSMINVSLADELAWESLAVYPPEIHLSSKDDLQHVVVVATRSDGVTQDVTEQATYKFADEKLVAWKILSSSRRVTERLR